MGSCCDNSRPGWVLLWRRQVLVRHNEPGEGPARPLTDPLTFSYLCFSHCGSTLHIRRDARVTSVLCQTLQCQAGQCFMWWRSILSAAHPVHSKSPLVAGVKDGWQSGLRWQTANHHKWEFNPLKFHKQLFLRNKQAVSNLPPVRRRPSAAVTSWRPGSWFLVVGVAPITFSYSQRGGC